MTPEIYKAFAAEIKLASIGERMRTMMGSAVEKAKGVGGAVQEKAKDVAEAVQGKAHDVADSAVAAASHKGKEFGSAIGEGLSTHAPEVGRSLGAGIAEHAGPVGEGIGRGMSQHFGNAGSELVHGARRAAEDIARSPKVRAGAAALALGYGGLKAHGAYRQHKRDNDQRRIADALENISAKKGR